MHHAADSRPQVHPRNQLTVMTLHIPIETTKLHEVYPLIDEAGIYASAGVSAKQPSFMLMDIMLGKTFIFTLGLLTQGGIVLQ